MEPSSNRSTSPLKVVLIVVGGLVLSVVALVGLGAAFVFLSWDLPVETEDRARVATVADLARYIDIPIDTENEKWTKTRYLDGSMDIDYEYEEPGDTGLYFSVTAAKERTAKDARTTLLFAWGSAAGVMKLMGGNTDITLEERTAGYSCCDSSRFAIIKADGNPVGNLFAAREGRRTYLLLVSGVSFEPDEDFQGLVGPSLEALRAW